VSLHNSASDAIPKIGLLDAPNLYNFEAKVPYGTRELGTFRNQDLCAKEQFERGRMKVIVMAVGYVDVVNRLPLGRVDAG